MPRPVRALAALLVLFAAAPAARGAEPHPLHEDLSVDLPLTFGAFAVWGTTELLKPELAPTHCRVCGTNALDAGARDLLVLGYGEQARRASDVLAYGVMPAAVAAHQLLAARAAGDVGAGGRDLLYIAEAVAVSGLLDQAVKFAVGRQRPFVHYGNWPESHRAGDPDDNLSFYSGHTAVAFSLASAAGTVSQLRGYPSTPWVWGVGMTLATAVGYLRIAGDKHYLTDVLTGAALGTAAGILVPRLLHPRSEGASGAPGASGAEVIPLPLGVLVVF